MTLNKDRWSVYKDDGHWYAAPEDFKDDGSWYPIMQFASHGEAIKYATENAA